MRKWLKNDSARAFFWEVHTRPCEVLGKVILALDTHGGWGGGVPKTYNNGSAGAQNFEKKCEKTSENDAEIAKFWGSSY